MYSNLLLDNNHCDVLTSEIKVQPQADWNHQAAEAQSQMQIAQPLQARETAGQLWSEPQQAENLTQFFSENNWVCVGTIS